MLKKESSINLAPMVDFLFLIGAMFAILALSKTALIHSDLDLVHVKPLDQVLFQEKFSSPFHIAITKEGYYKWIKESQEELLDSLDVVKKQFLQQKTLEDSSVSHPVKVFLHIDQEAQWQPIAQAIVALQSEGVTICPVYEVK